MVEGKEDKSEVSDLTGTKKIHLCIGDQLPCYADRKLHAGELYCCYGDGSEAHVDVPYDMPG